ncbi:MAG TPA: 5'/3'-nucleotidase SurE [Ilumatobacteraceae bacterium]|nr:5'/3'-nucleotidase SurE [Ilumatobacteraceae bacterium]
MRHSNRFVVPLAIAALILGACSDNDSAAPVSDAPSSSTAASTTTAPSTDPSTTAASTTAASSTAASTTAASTTAAESTTTVAGCTTAASGPLRILLVNDDGVINPAIDVLIGALKNNQRFSAEVTVVAPAEERSGSSDKTTSGGATYQQATTPGGNVAYAVNGFPADSVHVALDQLGLKPQLVLSGINPGQNVGPFAQISGTVGVGRTAIRRGLPALAVSAGMQLDQAQFDFGASLAINWIAEHCADLMAGTAQTDTVSSINLPTCPPAAMGPLLAVERATTFPDGANVFASSCDLSGPTPTDDVAAILVGYPSITQVPADL